MVAVQGKRIDFVLRLLKIKADWSRITSEMRTPLGEAVKSGFYEAVAAFLFGSVGIPTRTTRTMSHQKVNTNVFSVICSIHFSHCLCSYMCEILLGMRFGALRRLHHGSYSNCKVVAAMERVSPLSRRGKRHLTQQQHGQLYILKFVIYIH